MTAACGFTDYRSQGQIIPYVIVDIRTPTGTLSLLHLYVALSCHSGGFTIRLELVPPPGKARVVLAIQAAVHQC